MQITLDNQIINISIIKKNNKRIYFRYKDDNILYIYVHPSIKEKKIIQIINDNKDSILKLINNNINHQEDENYFYYLGKKYEIIYSDIDGILYDEGTIFIKDHKTLEKYFLSEVKRIFKNRVEEIKTMFADIPEFTLKFRKMKTRWGVCNCTNKTITLNTELLKRNIHLLDYVIIHEICHFYEANHSDKFWNHVKNYYPDYKKARKELKGAL